MKETWEIYREQNRIRRRRRKRVRKKKHLQDGIAQFTIIVFMLDVCVRACVSNSRNFQNENHKHRPTGRQTSTQLKSEEWSSNFGGYSNRGRTFNANEV